MKGLAISLALVVSGCAATATFHSKTGASYAQLVPRAVRCDDGEARAALAAGGVVIGTVTAKALSVRATPDDVADKASLVAAEHGGTHFVITERGIDTMTVTHPATTDTQCVETDDASSCQTTSTGPTESTYEKPTASVVVIRVEPPAWTALPAQIRPAR